MSYLLGIDAGGSKTLIRVCDGNGRTLFEQRAGGAQLSRDPQAAARLLAELMQSALRQAQLRPEHVSAVIGIAGGSRSDRAESLRAQLDGGFVRLQVCSDARTALYGAAQGQAVVAVTLGTGSSAMRLENDGQETLIGGWGFPVGDEGGGAVLGRRALRQLSWEIDRYGKPVSPLGLALGGVCGTYREALLGWLAMADAGRYASLAPRVFELRGQCGEADRLLARQVADVVALIELAVAGHDLPVVLLGGLALPTLSLLPAAVYARVKPAAGTSLDGALWLAGGLTPLQSQPQITPTTT